MQSLQCLQCLTILQNIVYNADIVDSVDFLLLKQSGTRLNSIEAISKTWPNQSILNMGLRDASASKKAKKLLRNIL